MGVEAENRSRLTQKISEVYKQFGFEPLETPALENLEVLFGSGGQENEKLVFKTLKRGDKLQSALEQSGTELADLGLRFDMTVPLCRVVGQYKDKIPMPWKVFHIGPVWRAERPQKGRYREFYQCDVDIIGAEGVGSEIEVLQAAGHALKALGLKNLSLRVNHRQLIDDIAKTAGFQGKLEEFSILLDKRDKLPTEKLKAELASLHPESKLPEIVDRLLENNFSLEDARSLNQQCADSIKNLCDALSALECGYDEVSFDCSLVRGMGYYTGLVFEVMHSGEGYALGGGGRYDNLIGRFMKESIPAVGFSLGFERILLLLQEVSSRSDILFVPVMSEETRTGICKLAQELRQAGVAVDVYPGNSKLKSQLKFASQKKYRWVLIAGESELESRELKLKDFETGEEEVVLQGHLASHLKSRCFPAK